MGDGSRLGLAAWGGFSLPGWGWCSPPMPSHAAGLKGTYQGLTATVLKQGSNQAIRFFVMTSLKNWYKGTVSPSPQATLAAPLAPSAHPQELGLDLPSAHPLLLMAQSLVMEEDESQGRGAPARGAEGSWCWSVTFTPTLSPSVPCGLCGAGAAGRSPPNAPVPSSAWHKL